MKPNDQFDAYQWLSPGYQPPPCRWCKGQVQNCEKCHGKGRGAPVFSRTEAIRRVQEATGHAACFGVFNNLNRKHDQAATCGEKDCQYKRFCFGHYLYGRYQADRIREESIEYLSSLFLNARAIERRTSHLSPFQAEIASLVRQWTDDTPQVAILGAFSSGKSTLLNRLVGKSLLPATRIPTTAVVTSIRYDDHAHGVLHYRSFARLILLSQDARRPDPVAIQAMRSWIRDPEHFGVLAICEVDEHGQSTDVDRGALLRELDALTNLTGTDRANLSLQRVPGEVGSLRRAICKRPKLPTERLIRTFEVTFKERPPKDIDLTSDDGVVDFGRHLTEPNLALSLHQATCYLPDLRLQSLNFLDTAGLCSPVGFHKDVTAELLKRRPDKMLVLLDARRLDCSTNAEALNVLGRFVSVPDDYCQVTFVLTFWDLALQNHMVEDSEPELDFDSQKERCETGRRFAKSKREELVGLLSSSVGVPCKSEPTVFTLGLGEQAPPEMLKSLDDLWKHLEGDCGSWVGVEMWAERWRAARGYTERILELHKETSDYIVDAIEHANDISDIDAETARINSKRQFVNNAVKRAKAILRDIVSTQKMRIFTEIGCLVSKSNLRTYLDSGYSESANMALNILQGESERQCIALVELYQGARVLRPISLDRKLLGLDASVIEQTKGKVSGILYGLASIWDFVLGSIYELNEGSRAAAREILRGKARETIDILDDAVDKWANQSGLVCQQAMAEFAEQLDSIAARKVDVNRYAEGIQRKNKFLSNCESPLRYLCSRVREFTDNLAAAQERIAASRRLGFQAVLYTDDGQMSLRKGRGQDLLLLFRFNKSRWKWLEISSWEWSRQFFPVAQGRGGRYVVFLEHVSKDESYRGSVVVPDGATRFELRLSSLEGKFYFQKRNGLK